MTPEQIRAHKCNLYTTYNSIDAVITHFNVTGEDVIAVLCAVNTTLELLAHETETEHRTVSKVPGAEAPF